MLLNFITLSLISKEQTPDLEQQQLKIEAKKDNQRLVQERDELYKTRTRPVKGKSK